MNEKNEEERKEIDKKVILMEMNLINLDCDIY